MKKNVDNIIGVDFQSWPIYKLTLREILEELGAEVHDGWIGFRDDAEILDIIPKIYEDDGMAYLVNEMFITSAYYDSKGKYINICREPIHPDAQEIINDIKEFRKNHGIE